MCTDATELPHKVIDAGGTVIAAFAQWQQAEEFAAGYHLRGYRVVKSGDRHEGPKEADRG